MALYAVAMVGERMASIRDDLSNSTVVAGMIGLVCGGTIAFASIAFNGSPERGFLAPLFTNALSLSFVVVVAVALGSALGLCIGVMEGVVAFMLAHRSAKTFRHLPSFATALALFFVLINATVAGVVTGFTYSLSGTELSDFFAPAASAVCTVLAIVAFARLQASDWPQPRERVHSNPRHYAEVLDLNAAEATLRHDHLAEMVRDRIIAEDHRFDDHFLDEPTIGKPRSRRDE